MTRWPVHKFEHECINLLIEKNQVLLYVSIEYLHHERT